MHHQSEQRQNAEPLFLESSSQKTAKPSSTQKNSSEISRKDNTVKNLSSGRIVSMFEQNFNFDYAQFIRMFSFLNEVPRIYASEILSDLNKIATSIDFLFGDFEQSTVHY